MFILIVPETLYLFGGWDGSQDLSDLWMYHIPSREWHCLSKDTKEEVSHFRKTWQRFSKLSLFS